MSNIKTTLALSALVFGSACSQDFAVDQQATSPQDYSLETDGVEVLEIEGVSVILSQVGATVDVLQIDALLGDDIDDLAIIADIPIGGWGEFHHYQDELPMVLEEMISDLSAAGEGELNLLPININNDIINSIEFALDHDVDAVLIAVDPTNEDLVHTILEAYES